MNQPLLAWRYWMVNPNGEIQGVYRKVWKNDTLNAICQKYYPQDPRTPQHQNAPFEPCSCGIYAMSSLTEARNYYDWKFVRTRTASLVIGSIPLIIALSWSLGYWRKGDFQPLFFTIINAVFLATTLLWFYSVPKLVRFLTSGGFDSHYYSGPLFGAVALTGKTLVYKNGVRAQRARIVCFVKNKKINAKLEEKIINLYKVPIFENQKEAQKYANEHANSIWKTRLEKFFGGMNN